MILNMNPWIFNYLPKKINKSIFKLHDFEKNSLLAKLCNPEIKNTAKKFTKSNKIPSHGKTPELKFR